MSADKSQVPLIIVLFSFNCVSVVQTSAASKTSESSMCASVHYHLAVNISSGETAGRSQTSTEHVRWKG